MCIYIMVKNYGLHPSESKVRAMKEAPHPTSVTELRIFLGLLNFYHKFLLDLATVLAPLHKLLLKDTKCSWSQSQEEAFNQAKSLL